MFVKTVLSDLEGEFTRMWELFGECLGANLGINYNNGCRGNFRDNSPASENISHPLHTQENTL